MCLEEGALFDRATLSIAEQEGLYDASKTMLVARYRALSRFRLQEYFDRQGEAARRIVWLGDRAHVFFVVCWGPFRCPARPPGHPPLRSPCAILRAGERLRQDMQQKWGGRFSVERRILVIDCVIE